MFSRKDAFRIIKHLSLGPDALETILDRLRQLENESEYHVDTVHGYLDNLDRLEKDFATETGNANFSLVTADVLQYNKKGIGLLVSRYENMKNLSNYLQVKAADFSALEGILRMLDIKLPAPVKFIGRIERN